MSSSYLEEMIVKFLDNKLTDEEKRQIQTAYDCEREIDEETEDEMKHALYKYVLNNIRWWKIIQQIKEGLEDEESESESESEED
jgi:hypothetical protein